MKKYSYVLLIILISTILFGCSSKKYEVNFDSNGGSIIQPIEVEEGKTIPIPEVSREEYTLEGWYTSIDAGETLDKKWSFFSDTVTQDITLYAKWEIKQYEITFKETDGRVIDTVSYDYGSNLNDIEDLLISYNKPGYEINLYLGESLTEIFDLDSMPAEDIELYLIFVPTDLEFERETRTILDYNGSLRDIVIPEKIDGISVTSIGDSAFYDNQLKSITIPNNVITIGHSAFFSNELTNITIPNSITTIGDSAFSGNELANITIPESVTSIGDCAFSNNQLTSIVIPNSVTSIGVRAFSRNNLTSVTLPNSLTTIGDSAFEYNSLTTVTIPDSVTSIGARAFDWIEMEVLNLESNENFVYENNLLLTADREILIVGVGEFTSVIIPASVTSIGDYAFSNNQLTSITIPASVTTIGDFAFSWNNLTSVTLPNSITKIEDSAFFGNKLTSITIPNSVITIGHSTFSGNELTNITIPANVTTIGDSAFSWNNLTSVTILGDKTRFNNVWTKIGFPEELMPE